MMEMMMFVYGFVVKGVVVMVPFNFEKSRDVIQGPDHAGGSRLNFLR
jgi:hypothetical protein